MKSSSRIISLCIVSVLMAFSFLLGTTFSSAISKATSTGTLSFALTQSPNVGNSLHFDARYDNVYFGTNEDDGLLMSDSSNVLRLDISENSTVKIEMEFNSSIIGCNYSDPIAFSDTTTLIQQSDFVFVSEGMVAEKSHLYLDKLLSTLTSSDTLDDGTYSIRITCQAENCASNYITLRGLYTSSLAMPGLMIVNYLDSEIMGEEVGYRLKENGVDIEKHYTTTNGDILEFEFEFQKKILYFLLLRSSLYKSL